MTQTKQDLLSKMAALGACPAANEYVADHLSDDAAEIWRTGTNIDHGIWLATRLGVDLGAFSLGCVARAKGYAADASASAAHYAAAASAARYAARYAADYAADAAAAAERKIQLEQLRALALEIVSRL